MRAFVYVLKDDGSRQLVFSLGQELPDLQKGDVFRFGSGGDPIEPYRVVARREEATEDGGSLISIDLARTADAAG